MKLFPMLGAASLLALCSQFAEAQTPAEMIVGRWACSANATDSPIGSMVVYAADGTAKSLFVTGSGEGDETVEAILDIKQTWRIEWDTLFERVTQVDPIRLTLGGVDISDAAAPPMREAMMKEETASSSLEIDASNMSMVDATGVWTFCTR